MRRDFGAAEGLRVGLLTLVTLYLLMALTLWPAYNWPVIDSWAFGYTVKTWLESGRLVFVDWGAMSLFGHVLWGALFSLPAGFSFGAVNLSTFVLSLVASLGTYLALRELAGADAEGTAPLAGALALVVNPAFIVLSYSYMTDVPFLAWYTLAAWCYLRGLRRRDWRWLALGSAFATLGVLIRQNGIVLPAALGAYFVWRWAGLRQRLWRGAPAQSNRGLGPLPLLAGVGLPAGALVVLTALSRLGVLPSRTNALQWISLNLSPALLVDVFRITLYLGLFLLPLSLAFFFGALRRREGRSWRGLVALAALGMAAAAGAIVQYFRPFKLPYIGTWRMMPYYPAVWSIFGTGSQEEWLAGVRPMVFSYRFWVFITALACAGAALLVWPLLRQGWREWREGPAGPSDDGWPTAFIILMAAAYVGPVLLFKGEIYDRYLMGLILPAAALILRAAQRQGVRLSLPAFAAPALIALIFSLGLAAEFIAWNGAAWNAASRVAATGAPIEDIDGGFVWNGWHFAERVGQGGAPAEGTPAYMELTPQITRRYVVSFAPLAGYDTMATEAYWSPLHWATQELLILRRR
jgi:hypothetical protein